MPKQLKRVLATGAQVPLRPIQSDAELEAAHQILRPRFLRNEGDLTVAESDDLGALTLLVEDYERAQFSFPKTASTPHERAFGTSSKTLG